MIYFADMLKANESNLVNPVKLRNELDKLICEYQGGTIYTNCFTPSPDTPRSLGAFFSGEYPSLNGCNTRNKYPGVFLNQADGRQSFPRILIDSGFRMISLLHQPLGEHIFPKDIQGLFSTAESLDSAVEKVVSIAEKDEDVLFFVENIDYHMSVDALNWDISANVVGTSRIAQHLESIISKFDGGIDFFDLFILFSDHGCKFVGKEINEVNYMDRDRTQVYLFTRDKYEEGEIKKDSDLTSIMEVRNYILKKANQSNTRAEKKLSPNKLPRIPGLLIEDYAWDTTKKNPNIPTIGSFPNVWVYRNDFQVVFISPGVETLYCENENGELIRTNVIKKDFISDGISETQEFGTGFSEMLAQHVCIESLTTTLNRFSVTYTDGTPKVKFSNENFKSRLKGKFKKHFTSSSKKLK